VEDTNAPDGNMLAYEVEINLNILAVLVLDGVSGVVDDTSVVAIDQSCPRQGVVQLHKQLTKPACLCHAISHDTVLRLNARTGGWEWRLTVQLLLLTASGLSGGERG
jgi:hypothetical protein